MSNSDPYTEVCKQMTVSTIVQWHQFIHESSKAYMNFITNVLDGWKRYQDVTNVMLIKETQKTLNNTTLYQ
jgi:hypothetical protein